MISFNKKNNLKNPKSPVTDFRHPHHGCIFDDGDVAITEKMCLKLQDCKSDCLYTESGSKRWDQLVGIKKDETTRIYGYDLLADHSSTSEIKTNDDLNVKVDGKEPRW